MRLRFRLFVALALVGLFLLAPDTDAPDARGHLASLRVREWLLAADGPLAAWQQDGSIPPLAVELRRSPPIEDGGELARQQAALARLAVEWATARTAEGEPRRVDATRGMLPLLVRVGEHGCQAELPLPDGPPARLVRPFATRLALLPALVAIGLAVLTGRVLLALLAACLVGGIAHVATAVPGADVGVATAVGEGVRHAFVDALWHRTLATDFHLHLSLFVVCLFLTVAVITRNGGVQGLVQRLQRRVTGPVGAQLAAFAAGLAVFFDDYTNCLLVGSTMRPLCDANRVSRAKLAYIVDSTAAPVAGLSVFSTWITYEMSQYRVPLALVTRPDGTPYTTDDAFAVFLATLPFRCYCVFALLLVLLCIVLRRDFGPMLAAERRARAGAMPPADAGAPPGTAAMSSRARNAVLPLLVLVLGTIGAMAWFGIEGSRDVPAADWSERVRLVLGRARSDVALLLASAAALLLAVTMTLTQRLLPWRELLRTGAAALRPLGGAFATLFLAWMLGHLCLDLGTGHYLTTIARGAMTAGALPLVLLLVAAAIAFATGTSFGTMAILLPNVVVLAHELGTASAFTGSAAAGGTALMLLGIGAVLEGAIFGDHCSPISDTTVLSSVGARCGLLEHVGTQLPYALFAFATSVVCGYLPLCLFGPQLWPWCWLAGAAVLAGGLWCCGRDPGRG